jgi:hypothetical protein
MLLKVLRLVFGLICGYLAVNWLPVLIPFHPDEFLGEFILEPLEFLAGAIALTIGMYAKGGLIRDGIFAAVESFKGKKADVSDIILAIGSVGCFFLLLPFGFWQTSVFFSFCFLYGMISFSPSGTEKET